MWILPQQACDLHNTNLWGKICCHALKQENSFDWKFTSAWENLLPKIVEHGIQQISLQICNNNNSNTNSITHSSKNSSKSNSSTKYRGFLFGEQFTIQNRFLRTRLANKLQWYHGFRTTDIKASPDIESWYRVRISSPDIEFGDWVRRLSPEVEACSIHASISRLFDVRISSLIRYLESG